MGKQWKQVTDFILGGSKITADGDCNHEVKRCLFLERKSMTNLDSLLKGRNITLPTKVHLVKAEHSLEGLMLKLKLQYLATWCEEITHWKKPWCCKRFKARGEGDNSGQDGWMASVIQQKWVWVNSRSCWCTGKLGVLQFMESQRVGHDWVTELNWTELRNFILGGSKMTANGNCSHEVKRCLLLGRKAMTNLDSILKSRDITLPTKVHLVKAMVFPVVMYGCESLTIK